MRQLTILSLVTLVATSFGCDQLSATMQGVSVITRTPDLANAEDMDPLLVSALPLSQLSVQEGVAVAVVLAEKESPTSTGTPTPISGATVQLAWETNQVNVCAGTEGGTYTASNIPTEDCGDASLSYAENTTYITRAETGSDLFTLEVEAPAAIAPANVSFSPNLSPAADTYGVSLASHSANTALVVDWSADPSAGERHAFITVVRINFVGDTGNAAAAIDPASWQADSANPVYDNAPRDPSGFINLVLTEPDTSETIPAGTFSQAGAYLLIITPAELSTAVSGNLALGSGALAGAGTAWIFWVD